MDKQTIVLTLYGTRKTINDFTVTLFDEGRYSFHESTVKDYCSNINDLKLKDDNWIYATIVKENQKIKFEKPGSYTDFDILGTLDDLSIQKVLREVNNYELPKALKSAEKKTLKAILKNVSKRAAKMLLEDMAYMGPVRLADVNEARRNIVNIIRRMEDTGEITVPRFSLDEMV
jgi:flagellar motor switch protein FliG